VVLCSRLSDLELLVRRLLEMKCQNMVQEGEQLPMMLVAEHELLFGVNERVWAFYLERLLAGDSNGASGNHNRNSEF